MMSKPVILVSVPHYLPGNKAGGPIRSIANMVEALGDELEFRIVTSDRDLNDDVPYPGIVTSSWSRVGKGWVWYLPAERSGMTEWKHLLGHTPHDAIYLNSLFHPRFTLRPLVAAALLGAGRGPVVLAPRGELSPGALALKRRKKSTFLALTKTVGLFRSVVWHASTIEEADLIHRHFGSAAKVTIACNLPTPVEDDGETPDVVSRTGKLNVVFLSRIARKKNLDYAIRVLARSDLPIQFDIWGPIEDEVYWSECAALMQGLPGNVTLCYRGMAEFSDVAKILGRYDLFFLPTRGENYGHAIAEAVSAGTPLLVSDNTPWRGLAEHGVGWDLPLEAGESRFAAALADARAMIAADRGGWRRRVRAFAAVRLMDPSLVAANRQMFLMALSNTAGPAGAVGA